MKILILVIAVIMLATATVVYADETSRGNYTTPITPLTEWLNTNDDFYHSHSYSQPNVPDAYKHPLGIGVNAVLYEFEGTAKNIGLDSVGVESKYDFNNQKASVFGVVNVNLWRTVKNVMK